MQNLSAMSPPSIAEYHAHVYFDPDTRPLAAWLREQLGERFAVRLGRWHDRPIGPHSKPMYQVAFAPQLFGQVVPFLMLNRGELDILVHPESGLGHAGDHTIRAAWLGHPLPLDVDYLRRIDAGEVGA
ncbi:DOPA 4,5-dioxygenase family protein [Immundisolibacter sp.]|jgi:aromatic ring-cleaving dioxygenase|uniref:DOPA 4,5-dioxygenase family protein n=1 Tax=Immundisolibacter sp. TaxID=1934948 RepID=UPI003567C631